MCPKYRPKNLTLYCLLTVYNILEKDGHGKSANGYKMHTMGRENVEKRHHWLSSMGARLLLLSALLFILLPLLPSLGDGDQHATTGDQVGGLIRGTNRRLMTEIDCASLCSVRCSEHSRPNRCNRACGTCCFRCKCVPPGTFGNRDMCGSCYTDMTTHRNETKCP